MKRNLFATVIGIMLFTFAGLSQTATPGVSKRQVNQHLRIAEGVQSGELTRREAVGLKAQQRHINRKKKVAKADGVVTPAERRSIHRSQNRASKNITVQKHDAQSR